MKDLRIIVENAVWSIALNDHSREIIDGLLTCERFWWKQGPHYKKRHSYLKSFLTANGKFYTGFLPRILEYADLQKMKSVVKMDVLENERTLELLKTQRRPELRDIELRDYQINLINDAFASRTGVIKAPARSGKTVIAGGLFSMFRYTKCLFIVHTKELLHQTYEEFTKFGFEVGRIGDGKCEVLPQITVAMHQSMVRKFDLFHDHSFGVISVDECHHVSKEDGNYAKILMKFKASWRLGFTATPSKDKYEFMCMEGLLGPIIGELTTEEAMKRGIIARPKINIVRVPENSAIKKLSYVEAYKAGVVRNRMRNRLIMKTAIRYLNEDMTVLILVTRVLHGFKIEEMFEKFSSHEAIFICSNIDADTQGEIKRLQNRINKLRAVPQARGSQAIELLKEDLEEHLELRAKVLEKSKERQSYRHRLNEGEIRCVIATNIWNEGVNIPNLNVVINASGGKSEKASIQVASRSLTKVPGKDYGIIVDLFDKSHPFMLEHFGERICLYMDEGWL